ncbi:hypothetical protein CVU37_05955 [candidate division BRC1 bacterium HGW-BRC1-1]|nr:MAG: hypothetical protein CVU37_05955 [candidate division BRC1 bacterium HGW-BRC1-1]
MAVGCGLPNRRTAGCARVTAGHGAAREWGAHRARWWGGAMFTFCDEDLVRYVALARRQLAALRRGEGGEMGRMGGMGSMGEMREVAATASLEEMVPGPSRPTILPILPIPPISPNSLPPLCALAHIRHFHSAYCRLAFSRLHLWSCLRNDLQADTNVCRTFPALRRGVRLALAAPRGSAKSTIHSLLLPVIDVVQRRERYIIIVSATLAQAQGRLRSLRRELLENDALARAYPVLRDSTCSPAIPPTSATRSALVVNGVRIEACGARCELRGLSWGEFRPTKIILDDAEASAAALTPHGRAATARWFAEVIEYLGDRYTHVEVVGTLLHPRSLLAELLKRPDFEAVHCEAVEQWSAATALWEEWRRLLTTPGSGDDERGAARARRFFLAHRAEMLAGTRVLWKAREDYPELMTQLALGGRAAFFKEKQNQPGGADLQLFDVARALRFEVRDSALWVLAGEDADPAAQGAASPRPVPTATLDVFGFLDPALGHDPARGDYAAIAVVGRDSDGLLHVLDLWMQRAAVPAQLDAVFHLHEAWGFREFGFEANHFQEVLAYELHRRREERRGEGRMWHLPMRQVRHREAKTARIDRLQGLVASGLLRFNAALSQEFFAQMEDYPHGRHDDGLDALAAAVTLAGEGGSSAIAPRRKGYITVGRIEPVRG